MIDKIDELKHGFKQMVAVITTSGDMQHEIELGRRAQYQ
jgi:hypothetical protein